MEKQKLGTITRTMLTSAAALAALVALAGMANAQDQEPIILPPINVGGYELTGTVIFEDLYHPNPMVPGTEISSDGGPVDTNEVVINGLRVCEVDDGIDLPNEENETVDLVECDVRAIVDAKNPCAGIHATIAENDVLDFVAADAIGAAADGVDNALNPLVGPTLASFGVQNANWGSRSHNAVYDCAGNAPPVAGDITGDASRIILSVGNPSYCSPFFCPGEIDIGTTFQNSTSGFEQTPYLGSSACSFEGTIVDCGEYEVTQGVTVSPQEASSNVSQSLPNGGRVDEVVDGPGVETPRAVVEEYHYETGALVTCGVRSQVYGDTYAALIPVVGLGVVPTGGIGPLDAQTQLEKLVVTTVKTYNENMTAVIAQWAPLNALASETVRSAMLTYYDAWPVFDDVYGPESPVQPASGTTQDGCATGSPPPVPLVQLGD